MKKKKQNTDREVQRFLPHRGATTYRISNLHKLESECFLHFMNSANLKKGILLAEQGFVAWSSGKSVQRLKQKPTFHAWYW